MCLNLKERQISMFLGKFQLILFKVIDHLLRDCLRIKKPFSGQSSENTVFASFCFFNCLSFVAVRNVLNFFHIFSLLQPRNMLSLFGLRHDAQKGERKIPSDLSSLSLTQFEFYSIRSQKFCVLVFARLFFDTILRRPYVFGEIHGCHHQ